MTDGPAVRPPVTGRVLGMVYNERMRQKEMKAAGRFEFTCADDGLTNAEKLTVLTEEVGEVADEHLALLTGGLGRVAREVLTQDGRRLARDTLGTREALLNEVTQVAAVAVAWMEALLYD